MVRTDFDALTELYLKCNSVINEIIKAETGRYPRDYCINAEKAQP